MKTFKQFLNEAPKTDDRYHNPEVSYIEKKIVALLGKTSPEDKAKLEKLRKEKADLFKRLSYGNPDSGNK